MQQQQQQSLGVVLPTVSATGSAAAVTKRGGKANSDSD